MLHKHDSSRCKPSDSIHHIWINDVQDKCYYITVVLAHDLGQWCVSGYELNAVCEQ